MLEVLGARNPQPREQAENDERSKPLGRGRQVVDRAGVDPEHQRLRDLGADRLDVGAGDRTADPREIGGDLAADVAAIEIVEPDIREMIEARRQRRLPQHGSRRGRLAVDEECRGETRHVRKLVELLRGEPRLARGDDIAVAGVADRCFEQHAERHAPAGCLRCVEAERPAGDRGRRRERGERPAGGDRVVALFTVKLDARVGAGASGRHQSAHPAGARARGRSRRRRRDSCADRRRRSPPPSPPWPRAHYRPRRGWRARPQRRHGGARRRRRGGDRRYGVPFRRPGNECETNRTSSVKIPRGRDASRRRGTFRPRCAAGETAPAARA